MKRTFITNACWSHGIAASFAGVLHGRVNNFADLLDVVRVKQKQTNKQKTITISFSRWCHLELAIHSYITKHFRNKLKSILKFFTSTWLYGHALLYVMFMLTMSLLTSSSIDYQLLYNVCESDTSAGQPKVTFAVTSHIYYMSAKIYWFCLFRRNCTSNQNQAKLINPRFFFFFFFLFVCFFLVVCLAFFLTIFNISILKCKNSINILGGQAVLELLIKTHKSKKKKKKKKKLFNFTLKCSSSLAARSSLVVWAFCFCSQSVLFFCFCFLFFCFVLFFVCLFVCFCFVLFSLFVCLFVCYVVRAFFFFFFFWCKMESK